VSGAVPFHVEISQRFRRARVFNLDEEKLRRDVLDPWTRGRVLTLGDRDWEPRDSKLIILEGPELADTDLSMGRGWSNAERVSENVTRRLVGVTETPAGGPLVVILAESESAGAAAAQSLDRLGLPTAPWSELRGRILGPPRDGRGPGYAAVLAIDSASPAPAWLFDAGLARGALGSRAVFVQLGDAGIPSQLAGVEVMRLDPDNEASLQALEARLAK
jgi:hypothetical protein